MFTKRFRLTTIRKGFPVRFQNTRKIYSTVRLSFFFRFPIKTPTLRTRGVCNVSRKNPAPVPPSPLGSGPQTNNRNHTACYGSPVAYTAFSRHGGVVGPEHRMEGDGNGTKSSRFAMVRQNKSTPPGPALWGQNGVFVLRLNLH